jgi:hypothetical protein
MAFPPPPVNTIGESILPVYVQIYADTIHRLERYWLQGPRGYVYNA